MIVDSSKALVIKALMGDSTPEYFKLVKEASSKDYTRSPKDAFMAGCAALMDENDTNIDEIMKVAAEYRVDRDIQKFAEIYKQARDDRTKEDYALVTKEGHYMPLHNKTLTGESDRYFNKHYMRYPFEWRPKIAGNIVKRAQKQGVTNLSPATIVYGIKDSSISIDGLQAGMNIANRACLCKESRHKKIYGILGKAIGTGKVKTTSDLVKVAEVVEKLDRAANLYPYFTQRDRFGEDLELCNPIVEIMCCKKAQDTSLSSILLGDNEYTIEQLSQVSKDKYISALGEELADTIEKADTNEKHRIISNLFAMDKSLLDKYIRG